MTMRHFILTALFLTLLCLGLLGCAGASSDDNRTVALEPCRLAGGVDALCGTVSVPADYSQPDGEQIELAVALLEATGSTPETDPLFLLAGGPGQAGSDVFPFLLGQFEQVNRSRDLVVVDQRGTGKSGALTCDNLNEEDVLDVSDEAVVALMDECRRDLEQRFDLTQYTTASAAADLDRIRAALGYDQINLYGISYGTRLAQEYMRRHPERVRSVVLDSVTSPGLVLFRDMPADAQRALDLLLERCAADEACGSEFPDLEAEFQEILARLETPQTIEIIHPRTNEALTLTVDRHLLTQFIFNIMYSTELQTLLPLLIHEAYETDDYGPLLAQGLIVSESAGTLPGLLYAVTCSEDAPLIDLELAAEIQAATDFGPMAGRFLDICAGWPRAQLSADFRDPLQSDIPTLMLSGETDPVTPPHYAAEVAAGLPNSLHLTAPGHGHGVLGAGCLPRVVARFVAAGSTEGLDVACLDELQPPPFFLNFAGSAP